MSCFVGKDNEISETAGTEMLKDGVSTENGGRRFSKSELAGQTGLEVS